MHTFTKIYTLDFELNFASKYKFTKCRKCFNTKTGREIKQRLNGGSFGYYINSKFMSLTVCVRLVAELPTEFDLKN